MKHRPYSAFCLIGFMLFFVACGAIKETRRTEKTFKDQDNLSTPVIEEQLLPEIEVFPLDYQAAHTIRHDLLHTRLDARFDWQRKYLLGTATLTLQPHFYPSKTLILNAKGFEIESVKLGVNGPPLQYKYDSLELHIQLDREYQRHEKFTIWIDYTARPYELTRMFPDQFSYENQGLYFIQPDSLDPKKPYQIWTSSETYGASCWFPTIDSPNQKSTQEFFLNVEDRYKTLSNGKLVSSTYTQNGNRTDYWKQDIAHAPYLFVIAVGDYHVEKDKWRDKEVNYYVEKEYAPYAKSIFGNTPEMIEFFSKKLGYDYPWDKYSQAVVRDFIAGAMENTSATLLYEEVQMTDKELEDHTQDDIIAHELFHHWFGDLVTCESWSNLALNESFATYGEYLWFEYKYGREKADQHLAQDLKAYLMESEYKKEPIIRYKYHNADDDLFDRHSYQKGGCVLHMLRNYTGDEAFFASVNLYLKNKAYKTAEINDLRMAFEEVTGEDLNWFFNQWFLTKGHPQLEITHEYDTTTKKISITVLQKQVEETIFDLPSNIDIYYKDKSKQRYPIRINKRKQTFVFDVKETPASAIFDADKILLCEKIEKKSTQGYIDQYYFSPLYLDRYEAIMALKRLDNDLAKNALFAALDDTSPELRQEALEFFDKDAIALHPEWQQKIIEMALNDPQSNVRASALARLAATPTPQVLDTYSRAMSDKSPRVVNMALQGIFAIDPSRALWFARMAEHLPGNAIVHTIAEIYAAQGESQEQLFFERQLATADSPNRYGLIEYYADFLKRLQQQSNPVSERSMAPLRQIAQNDPDQWLRIHAEQTIQKLKN